MENWMVERDKESGALWVVRENGFTVCDMYFTKSIPYENENEIHTFMDAEANAELIIKAPQQQALIDELVEALEKARNCISRFVNGKGMGKYEHILTQDIGVALAKAERKE